MSTHLPQITKAKIMHVLDSAYAQRDFQTFMSVMTHAQTCNKCSKLFFASMKMAENHLDNELK